MSNGPACLWTESDIYNAVHNIRLSRSLTLIWKIYFHFHNQSLKSFNWSQDEMISSTVLSLIFPPLSSLNSKPCEDSHIHVTTRVAPSVSGPPRCIISDTSLYLKVRGHYRSPIKSSFVQMQLLPLSQGTHIRPTLGVWYKELQLKVLGNIYIWCQ